MGKILYLRGHNKIMQHKNNIQSSNIKKQYSILLVDDDPHIIKVIGNNLAETGYRITTANSGERAFELLNKTPFDLVIADMIMGQIDGMQVLEKAKELYPETMVMILTGLGDLASAIDAFRLGVDDYLLKPLMLEELHFRVEDCLRKYEDKNKIKQDEEKLKYAQNIIDSSLDMIVSTDNERRIVEFNRAAEKTFGYRKEEVLGKDVNILYASHEEGKELREKGAKSESFVGEITNKRKDGSTFPALLSVAFMRDKTGVPIGAVGVSRDITEIKETQVQLARAKESAEFYAQELKQSLEVSESLRLEMEKAKKQAEAADRAKSEFLASMSHEIRTPMTAVIGMSDLLWETPLSFEQKRFLDAIRSSGENLLQLINDILDLSKVEAGQIELEKTPFDLIGLVSGICETQAFHSRKKNLELVWWIAPGIETLLLGDPVRLGQILTNLIGNAIKFTEKGELFVKVKRHGVPGQTVSEGADSEQKLEKDRTIELLFSVSDTGIGIPSEKREFIFDRFTQADSSTTRKYGGTGLGLTISRRLTELMGGSIWVESEVGQGSTFYFTARFEVQSDKKYVQTPEADITDVKILIIDDNATNRMVLSEMVSRWGALVTEKEDGNQGLAELKSAKDAGNPYDLVLLDSKMPGLDGFQVAEQIKEDPVLSCPVIMMLISDGQKFAKERSKELEITDYLLKPIKWSDLKEAVISSLNRIDSSNAEQPRVKERAVREELTPSHILIVEDNEQNRILIETFLKKTPYTLDTAENGKIAVEKFKNDKYNLVLMDIEMQIMDGYKATKEIRKWEAENQAKPTPIIALTAHTLEEHRQKSLDAGCSDHLSKPIKKADLLKAIEKYTLKS
jgi:PAS domain S-box-containing protein